MEQQKIIELSEMPDSYFSKATRKNNNDYEYGLLNIQNGQLVFLSANTEQPRTLSQSEIQLLVDIKGTPIETTKLLEKANPNFKTGVPCKIKNESEEGSIVYYYVVPSVGQVSLNNALLAPGSIIVFQSNGKTSTYFEFSDFCRHYTPTERFDIEQAKGDIRQGNTFNNVTNGASVGETETLFETANPVKENGNVADIEENWAQDKDELYKNAKYIMKERLYQKSANGAPELVGYKLEVVANGSFVQVQEKRVMDLAGKREIRNAKLVTSKLGKPFLQGINCSIENLPQAYWEN